MGTTRQTRHSWPWRVDWIHEARVSGDWRAWVSGGPAGWVEPRTVASSPANGRLGEPQTVASSPANGGLSEPRTAAWSPANGGLGVSGGVGSRGRRRISPTIGGLEGSRPADSRHSRRSRRTPTLTWRGLGRKDKWRLPCRVRQNTQEQNKRLSKTEHKTRWRGAAYFIGLVFCQGAHSREKRGTRRRGLNSNFRQGKTRQGWHRQETPGSNQ